MKVIIYNGFECDQVKLDMMERYISYAAYELMPEEVAKEIKLEINVKSDGIFSASVQCDDDEFMEEDPRNFNMDILVRTIEEEDFDELMITMCHEIVHIKQMAMNELSETGINTRRIWKRKTYEVSGSLADYYNSPWEIEAYGMEKALFYKGKEFFSAIEMMLKFGCE